MPDPPPAVIRRDGLPESERESPPLSDNSLRRAIENAIQAGLAAVDVQGRQTYVNRAFCTMVGWSEEELSGAQPPFAYWPPEEIENIVEAFRRTLTGGAPIQGFELRFVRRSGERFDVLVHVAPLTAEDGAAHGWLASVSDISHQKAVEQALRDSERRLRFTLDAARVGTWDWNVSTNEVRWSENLEEIHGLPSGAFGSSFESFLEDIDPDYRDYVMDTIRCSLEKGEEYLVEYPVAPKNGRTIWVEGRGHAQLDAFGAPMSMAGICMDITERKAAEEEVTRLNRDLRHRIDELQALLEVSPIGLAVAHDSECKVITSNPAFARMLQIEPDANASKSAPEGEALPFKVMKDGRELAPHELPMQRAASEDVEIRDFEEEIQHESGEVSSLLVYAAPLHNENGSVRGVLGAIVDITEIKRVERELRELNETLEQRVTERTAELEQMNSRLEIQIEERKRTERDIERMNAELLRSNKELQDFAHVASHDLKEPLRKIASFVDLLIADNAGELNASSRSYLGRIQEAALRLSELINDLLAFSRLRTRAQPFQRVQLELIAREVISDLEVQLAEVGGRIEFRDLPEIDADPTQMRQLFQNLIGNALKFHRPGEKPVIRIRAEADEGTLKRAAFRILLEDNGIGFEERYLERIFSPFQRLHDSQTYPGSGMGLAICRRIVERHHGEITARSAPDAGATFIVILPARHGAEAI